MSAYDPHPWLRWASWRVLLFEHGQGWLRWRTDTRESWEYVPDAMASYHSGDFLVAPPLRAVGIYLRQWLAVRRMLVAMTIGVPGCDDDEGRFRLSWEEVCPYWDPLKDPDRGKGIWR